jgi:hypothetical protein
MTCFAEWPELKFQICLVKLPWINHNQEQRRTSGERRTSGRRLTAWLSYTRRI